MSRLSKTCLFRAGAGLVRLSLMNCVPNGSAVRPRSRFSRTRDFFWETEEFWE